VDTNHWFGWPLLGRCGARGVDSGRGCSAVRRTHCSPPPGWPRATQRRIGANSGGRPAALSAEVLFVRGGFVAERRRRPLPGPGFRRANPPWTASGLPESVRFPPRQVSGKPYGHRRLELRRAGPARGVEFLDHAISSAGVRLESELKGRGHKGWSVFCRSQFLRRSDLVFRFYQTLFDDLERRPRSADASSAHASRPQTPDSGQQPTSGRLAERTLRRLHSPQTRLHRYGERAKN
jgi:hypothetical protein